MGPSRRGLVGASVALATLLAACVGAPDAVEEETNAMREPISVWMDVDPATGLPDSEVDDGLMMLYVFHSPELEVRGVSVVFGNTSLENGLVVGRDVVERFSPSPHDVHAGAASAAELGVETEAVRALAAALEERPMTILAVGPLTNIGSLLQLRPDLEDRIERVIVVAGRRPGQSFRTAGATLEHEPFRDFNFELDVAAARVVLDSGVELVMAPWEVSSHLFLRSAALESLAQRGTAGQWVASAVESWLGLWRERFGVDGFNPFDILAALWLTHPDQIESLEVGVWIEEGPNDRSVDGEPAVKPYLLVDPSSEHERRAIYTYLPNRQLEQVVLERLAAPAAVEMQ